MLFFTGAPPQRRAALRSFPCMRWQQQDACTAGRGARLADPAVPRDTAPSQGPARRFGRRQRRGARAKQASSLFTGLTPATCINTCSTGGRGGGGVIAPPWLGGSQGAPPQQGQRRWKKASRGAWAALGRRRGACAWQGDGEALGRECCAVKMPAEIEGSGEGGGCLKESGGGGD